jgi:hypothetical protein
MQGDTELLGGGIGLAIADHFAGPYRRISTRKALFAAEDGSVAVGRLMFVCYVMQQSR